MYQSSTLRADTFSRCVLACEKYCYALYSHYENAVPYPDLEIRGGGGGGSSRPLDKGREGGLQKNFFRPFGPQFDLRIRWGRGSPVPLP